MGCKRHSPAQFSVNSRLLSLFFLICIQLLKSSVSKPFYSSSSRLSYVFPVHARHGTVRARGLLRNGSLPVLGTVRDVGYFYTQLWLGTPARRFSVIIDTGSTITYIPCTGCGHCGRHQHGAFDTGNSSTYDPIGCNHAKCDCGSPPCDCRNQKCYYYRTYAEKSSSEGWLVQDMYYFPDNVTTVPVVFGCENREMGEIYNQMADGILGMGNNNIAFHSQLHAAGVIDDVFGLCFAWPSGGAMMLGRATPPNLNFSYTPMVAHPHHKHYFNIKLTGIRIGNETLDIDYRKYFDAGYGTVMDSGTTFTYLPSRAFQQFLMGVDKAAAAAGMRKEWAGDSQFQDVCWKGSVKKMDELEGVLPTAEFVFYGNTTLRLPPYRYLFMLEPGVYCLGVFNNGNSGALIGGISVRNVLVQYDREQQRYGFAEAECASIGLAATATDPLHGAYVSRAVPKPPPPTAPPHASPPPSPPPPPQPPPAPFSRRSGVATSWAAVMMTALVVAAVIGICTAAVLYLYRQRTAVVYAPVQLNESEDSRLLKSTGGGTSADTLEMTSNFRR